MPTPLPHTTTAPFRSVTFPLHHDNGLPVLQYGATTKRRSLSEGHKNKRNKPRKNKVVPIVVRDASESGCFLFDSSETNKSTTTTTILKQNQQQQQQSCWNARKWLVTSEMLEPVPQYYPLEHASTIMLDQSAELVSTRVSDFMKRHSMACVFEPTRVECRSAKLTEFTVKLWKQQQQDRVVLEVQRRSGSSVEMQKIRNGLFHYVSTGRDCSSSSLRMGPPAHCTVECVKRSLIPATVAEQQAAAEQAAADALVISAALLSSPCVDQNKLGMESLRVLSNPTICSRDCARTLSRKVVYGQNDKEPFGIRTHLLKYFTNIQELDDDDSNDESNHMSCDSRESEYEQGDHFGEMHHVALQVLVNALEVAVQEKQQQQQQDTLSRENLYSSDFFCTLLDAFLYDLSVATLRPQEAAMSARCLDLFMELMSPKKIVTSKWMDVLVPLLMEAHEYGKVHHLQLENATHDLMTRLWQEHNDTTTTTN